MTRPHGIERRARPTPMLSRYWLRGRRRQAVDGYVDRYTAGEYLLYLIIIVLSVADVVFTIAYLERGGEEANPLMQILLHGGGYVRFAAVKMIVTTLGVMFLLMRVRFRYVRTLLYGLLLANLALVSYHVYLI